MSATFDVKILTPEEAVYAGKAVHLLAPGALGYLGILPPTTGRTIVAQICTFIYFGFFLLMPWWSTMGKFKPVPDRVTFKPH